MIGRAWGMWERWWFEPVDLRVYRALRMGWGLLGVWFYAPLWPLVGALFADAGLVSLRDRSVLLGPERLSLLANPLWSVAGESGVRAFFAGFLVCLVAVALGRGGRWALGAAWIGLVSLMNRDGLWTDGADVVMRVFGALLLLTPFTAEQVAGERGRAAGWPLRLFQLQVCILYVRTGLVKALDFRWQDGIAVHQALSTSYFWRFPMDAVLANPVFHALTYVATWGTLVFEIGFPLVLLPRLRRYVLAIGVSLHLGVAAFLDLGGFSEAILWTYLAFMVFPAPPGGTPPRRAWFPTA